MEAIDTKAQRQKQRYTQRSGKSLTELQCERLTELQREPAVKVDNPEAGGHQPWYLLSPRANHLLNCLDCPSAGSNDVSPALVLVPIGYLSLSLHVCLTEVHIINKNYQSILDS